MAYYELKITVPDQIRDTLIVFLNEKGSLGLIEEERTITAYFRADFDIASLVHELAVMNELLDRSINQTIRFSRALIPEQDWNESWKKSFIPINIGTLFTILPPWEPPVTRRVNLIIDPGMAFGTGHHETTRSCLVLMEKYHERVPKERFLDLGTGTGLLAIAAAKTGYKQVMAVDTDPLATQAARRNAGLNAVAAIDIRDGSINESCGLFDCIIANIISAELILLSSSIASHLKPSAISILSGILSEQADEVANGMEKAGLQLIENYPDGKWISLVVGKPR